MFSYTAIFVTCIVAAIIIPWAYRLLVAASSKLRQQVLPKPVRGPTGHLKLQPSNTPRQRAVAQWQLKRRDLLVDANNNKPTHNGSGDKLYYGSFNDFGAAKVTNSELPRGEWMKREELSSAVGTSYRINHRVRGKDLFPKIFRKARAVDDPPTYGSR